MIRAHKIRLNPTRKQVVYFRKATGAARFVYNWALARVQAAHMKGKQCAFADLKREFNTIKRGHFPWVLDVTKCAAEGAYQCLSAALMHYGKSQQGKRKGKPVGFPKFKNKKHSKQSFYLANDTFHVDGNWITIPKLGRVNLTEPLRFQGKILSAIVSSSAGWWWVSVVIDVQDKPYQNSGAPLGVDLGITSRAICSDGTVFENQKHLQSAQRKVRHYQRWVSRTAKDSRNRERALLKLAKAHYEVTCKRQDALHKMTTLLATRASILGLEDLHVNGMLKNHHLAKVISDASFGAIKCQLTYKSLLYGATVVLVDRFFPSSRMCHACGYLHAELTLADRKWRCQGCGCYLDRDLNAALNIRDEALRLVSTSR